ncbi:carbon-nitrogen hydrolase [Mariprofundus ferrooxydans]|uniref:Glycosyl hydrolase, family 10 n=1 Tax=Mariprofundus ferrooxydans PV-1 TaxID=314345 RepID=Q0F089_9PROT|nr:carbon-nitrogen hydrolase [Mariprofundus ferrooxydans]EAU54795.1 glycosyl hydrolase, family 10 [Mariprofundus ferrooxydans PV-1]KON46521.1 acyltransferase [Mariprofundus ferrooxydans]
MSVLRTGVVQQRCSEDKAANLAASIEGIREAAAMGARLVVLQELHGTPYFCQVEDPGYFDLAEPIPGPSSDILGAVAAELGVVIVASLFERRAAGLYHNTAVVLEADGSIAGIYRKMHIPDDPAYYEKFYFTPGDIGFEPIDTSVGRLGVLVCWDQWYPEAARLMAMAGADMLIYPTAIGWAPSEPEDEQLRQRDAWEISMRGHAVANGLPVICANRTGFEAHPYEESGLEFWGGSFVVGPQGEMLSVAAADEQSVMVVDVDLRRSEAVRRMWPFLRDRRIDMYDELTLRYRD